MSELTELVKRFVAVVLVGLGLGWSLSRAWQPDTPGVTVLETASEAFDVGVGQPIEFVPALLVGLWFGLLVAVTADHRKHVHGTLLAGASVIGVVLVTLDGHLFANVPLTDPVNLGALLLGGLLGTRVDATIVDERLLRLTGRGERDSGGTTDRLTSGRSVVAFTLFSTVVAVGALFQLAVVGQLTAVDVAVATGYVYAMTGFLSYEVESNTQAVGPVGVGKTYLLYGLHSTFSRRSTRPVVESPALDDQIETIANKEQGDGWELEGSVGFADFKFQYHTGTLFPVRVSFAAQDHRGEYLETLARLCEDGRTVRSRLDRLQLRIRGWVTERVGALASTGVGLSDDERHRAAAYRIINAEQLLAVVDMQRVLSPHDSPELQRLKRVAEHVEATGGDVFVVTTKADCLVRAVRDGNVRGVDGRNLPALPELVAGPSVRVDDDLAATPRMADGGLAGRVMRNGGYDDMAEEVTAYLNRQYPTNFSTLLELSERDTVFPVFYRTVETGDGEVRPLLDEGGNLQPVGFERLADAIEYEP